MEEGEGRGQGASVNWRHLPVGEGGGKGGQRASVNCDE